MDGKRDQSLPGALRRVGPQAARPARARPGAAARSADALTMKTYVHASDDDLKRGRQALAKIHRL